MTLDDFVSRRREGWLELESAISAATRGRLANRSTSELERFGILCRRAAGDLAIARRDHPDATVAGYLNGLCSRAHPLLYAGDTRPKGGVIAFYRTGVPRAFREAAPYVLASAGLLLVGALAGALAVALRPDLRASLIPPSLFDEMARGQLRSGVPDAAAVSPVIILNNVRVALLLFAGGVLLGIPTAVVLMVNGWILGTLAAAVGEGGYGADFWALIAPHGVIELSIVVIAGGAGLMVGDSVLRPGLRRRADSLVAASRRAIRLVLGAAALLVIAGVLEGYVSPSGLAPGLKFAVGGGTGLLLYTWLLSAGRVTGRLSPRRLS